MKTIGILAKSRLRYNRSTTVLTTVALALTTCLLAAVGLIATGLKDVNMKIVAESASNYHASIANVSRDAAAILERHRDVEALSLTEPFATVVKDKMNAMLLHGTEMIPGVNQTAYTSGRPPEGMDEIAGPPAFFQRLGYENPAIGDKVEVSFRVYGKGEILQQEFVISGLVEQRDISDLNVADTRIVYSAVISKALADSYLEGEDRYYRAYLRAYGEETLNYDEMKARINAIAADAGIEEGYVGLNSIYLLWTTDPGTETTVAIVGISTVIVLFASLVLYSIYYVGVITNVQEMGKLKALGATRRQMRGLMLREGLWLAACAIPFGLTFGYLVARGGLWLMMRIIGQDTSILAAVSLFSLPVVLFAVAMVLLTTVLSLLRPIRMVSRISPVEAIVYQEASAGKQARRRGYNRINLHRMSAANLGRNRRRTVVTMISMGLGGVLFLGCSGLVSSMNELDYSRQHLEKGEFKLDLRYSANDATYPENNLDSLQASDIMGESLLAAINAIPGVTGVEYEYGVLASFDYPGYQEGQRMSVGFVSRADMEEMKQKLRRGELDYDRMVEENGIIFPYDAFFESQGLTLGDEIPMTLYDGENEVPFTGKLAASTLGGGGEFLIPIDLMDKLITHVTPALAVYIHADPEHYGSVKAALKEITDSNAYFQLVSMDEEIGIAKSAIDTLRWGAYLLLGILGVIAFMNLINTMVTSIVTRKREIGVLQAIGMSDRQLRVMLQWEGLIFTAGTLLLALTLGNLTGYLLFLWAKNNSIMGIIHFHYPLAQTVILVMALLAGQLVITDRMTRRVHKESIIERIRLS